MILPPLDHADLIKVKHKSIYIRLTFHLDEKLIQQFFPRSNLIASTATTSTISITSSKVMGSIAEVPKLQAFPNGTAMETIFEALYRDGAVVIRNLVSADSIAGIQSDIKPYMDAEYNSGLDVSITLPDTKTSSLRTV